MRQINKIIVHCSATPAGRNFSVDDIDAWHRERGFNGVGYHYIIYLDGTIATGRPEETIGAHCKGHNADSIGVCYIGGLDNKGRAKDTRTVEQRASLLVLLTLLKERYPGATIKSHRDFAAKACPCFDATKEYASI